MFTAASAYPIQKVTATFVAGLIMTILLWALKTYGGIELPGEVATAITTLVGLAIGYLTPLLPGEVAPVEPPAQP